MLFVSNKVESFYRNKNDIRVADNLRGSAMVYRWLGRHLVSFSVPVRCPVRTLHSNRCQLRDTTLLNAIKTWGSLL